MQEVGVHHFHDTFGSDSGPTDAVNVGSVVVAVLLSVFIVGSVLFILYSPTGKGINDAKMLVLLVLPVFFIAQAIRARRKVK